jgi:hypothetical protein
MHTYQGLFWEHWNQSRLWIIGAASFLLLMTLSVWLNHDWIMREFRNDPFELDKFAWVVGFTAVGLMFVNYRVREVNLYFPRRQFALPCRTMPIVLSHLVFKTLAAAGLGLLIALVPRGAAGGAFFVPSSLSVRGAGRGGAGPGYPGLLRAFGLGAAGAADAVLPVGLYPDRMASSRPIFLREYGLDQISGAKSRISCPQTNKNHYSDRPNETFLL